MTITKKYFKGALILAGLFTVSNLAYAQSVGKAAEETYKAGKSISSVKKVSNTGKEVRVLSNAIKTDKNAEAVFKKTQQALNTIKKETEVSKVTANSAAAKKAGVTVEIKKVSLTPKAVLDAKEFGETVKKLETVQPLNSKEIYELYTSPVREIAFGEAHTYVKTARIQARQATKDGEIINTIVKNGTVEETDNVTKVGDWIVTNPGGEQYIVLNENFIKKYEPALELGEGWYKPVGGGVPQEFVQTKYDMKINASWGKEENLKKGGFLNITNKDDIYGVEEQAFYDTYSLVK